MTTSVEDKEAGDRELVVRRRKVVCIIAVIFLVLTSILVTSVVMEEYRHQSDNVRNIKVFEN